MATGRLSLHRFHLSGAFKTRDTVARALNETIETPTFSWLPLPRKSLQCLLPR